MKPGFPFLLNEADFSCCSLSIKFKDAGSNQASLHHTKSFSDVHECSSVSASSKEEISQISVEAGRVLSPLLFF